MKRTAMFAALSFAALLAVAAPLTATAQGAKVEAQVASSVREVLQANVGKRVAVRVDGQDIEGTVVAVGADTVVISKLSGKDFYDAVVSIGKIGAVIYKAR